MEAYGTWLVTTEGDCEGRTTRELGVHTGYLDDIAFALADQAYYGLRFRVIDLAELKNAPKKGAKVQVSLEIDTGTWDMDGKTRVEYFKQMLKGRNVYVKPGQYYACVELIDGKSPEQQEAARQKVLVDSARNKLSEEELEALLKSVSK